MALENKSHQEMQQDAATYIQLKADAGEISDKAKKQLFDVFQIPNNKFDKFKYKLKNLFIKQTKLDDVDALKKKIEPILQQEKVHRDGQDEQGNEIGGVAHLSFESFREGYKQYLGKEKNTYEIWAILAGQETPRLNRRAKAWSTQPWIVAANDGVKQTQKNMDQALESVQNMLQKSEQPAETNSENIVS